MPVKESFPSRLVEQNGMGEKMSEFWSANPLVALNDNVNTSTSIPVFIKDFSKEEDLTFETFSEKIQFEQRLQQRNNDEWNRLGKLVLLSALSALGTLGNIFAISAIMTEDQLRKKGNALLVNLMLAALLITVGVLPADIVALLAGWASPTPVCPVTWILSCLAAHTSLATLPCIAWENRLRLTGRPIPSAGLIALVILCWVISVSITCAQWVGGLGPSHCGVVHTADAHTYKVFTGTVGVVLVLAPLALAIAVHARTLLAAHTNIRPPRRGAVSSSAGETKPFIYASGRELALPATNLAVSAVAGSCWAVGVASDWWADDKMLVSLMWFPLSAATATGFLYGAHKPFREAYIQLFHYCCCKTSVSLTHRARNDAAAAAAAAVTAAARPASDVRVHIIPGYNMYSTAASREHRPCQHKPQRFSTPKEGRRPKMSHKKDVYEL